MRHREARGSRDQLAIARLGGVRLATHDMNRRLRTYGTMTQGPFLDPSEMFDDVYAELPAHLEKQRREMLALEE